MKNVEDVYPLTPMQRGMLFHALHEPDAGMYFEQARYALEGELILPVFQRAWDQVVKRHSALRTAFVWQGRDEPLQVVRGALQVPWSVEDWRGLPPAQQLARLDAFCAADRQRGLDLSRAPLMRMALFQMSDDRYRLVWSFHHLLFDGWSLPIILNEVFSCYEAFADGAAPKLPPVRPYRDYITWLQRQDQASAAAFWCARLGSFSAATSLGVDRPLRPDAGPLRPAQQETLLSAETGAALRVFARQHRLTLNTLVQGAWALLLGRYSGSDDLVFGTTVSGRPPELVGVETIVGLFINTLPVRVRLPASARLRDWLQQLQAQQADLRQFEHSPLVDVQGWSGVPRGLPLFESLVIFENYPANHAPAPDARPPRLRLAGIEGQERTNYALNLSVAVGDGVALKVGYDQRRFDDDTITRLLGHMRTLLEHLPAYADSALARLPILTDAEQRQIFQEWNATARVYPRDANLPTCFAEQVAQRPDAIALSYAGGQMSYRELNARANRLAHHLRAHGVGWESRVAVGLRRSPELIIALLAVLKADAAYVPLDPAYPPERLAFMLQDADAQVLITERALFAHPPMGRTIYVDDEVAQIAAHPPDNPASRASAGHVAYVMYTSGSTGQPKGSSIVHRSIVRLVKATNYADLSAEQVLLQFAPASFDAATLEIWGALLNGARLVLSPPDLIGLSDLGQIIQEQQVSLLWLTSGLFSQMVDEQPARLRGVRQLLTGGDVVSPQHVRQALEALEGCTIINGYGPTENTTFTCCYPVADQRHVSEPLPIGRPIANTQVYILDRLLQPVPVGVTGDIYAAGDGLARDYHRQPALTAERFIPHPYSADPGARLYVTGDQGRYRADGTIEFLGRADSQVKIRGYRIELGEIETVFAQHPVVRSCVVLVQELVPGQKRLAAFFVPNVSEEQPMPSPRVLREFLQERLPAYMIPSSFAPMESLPLTPNGKVDRKALLAPDRMFTDTQTEYVAPRDQTELQLTEVWEHVLDIRPIGVRHNFFDLGGQSLLAMRMTTHIQRVFGKRISTATLFREPTIAQLAQHLRTATEEDAPWSPLVLLQEGGSEPPLFLLSPGGGSPFCYIPLARHLRNDRPCYGLQSRGVEPGQQPFQTIGEMAECYIAAMRSVQPNGPYLLAGWSAGGTFALEVAQRLRQQGQAIALLCVMDTLMQKPDNMQDVLNYADQLIAFIGPPNLPMSIDEFYKLDREEQIRLVVELAWQTGLVAPDTGREQVLRIVDVVGANIRISMTYDPQPYDGQISLFKTFKDPQDAKHNKVQISSFDDLLGWGEVTTRELDVVLVSGDHQNMLSMPHVRSVAEQLQLRLDVLGRDECIAPERNAVYSLSQ